MAAQPVIGSTSWGAAQNAFTATSLDPATGKVKNEALQVADTAPIDDTALTNKKYVDDGGERLVDDVATAVHTKYIRDVIGASPSSSFAHGITDFHDILSVTVALFIAPDRYSLAGFKDSGDAFFGNVYYYTATQIVIEHGLSIPVGANIRIKIDYID